MIGWLKYLRIKVKMRKIKITYEVYRYDELSEEAKLNATNKEIQDMLEYGLYEDMTDNQKKAVGKANEMLTPWFAGEYIWEYAKDEIEEQCRQNDYLEDGSYFWQGECGQFETEEK